MLLTVVNGIILMKTKFVRLSILILIIIGISLVLSNREQLDAAALQQWIENAGAAGPVLFILLYAVGTVFFFPGSILTLTGGAIFGPILGTFYNLTGATIGATIAFIISRYLVSDIVEQKTGGRLKQLKDGVEGEGWRFVAFVRLVPLFPFNLLNFALGLTRIKLSHYIIATYLFMFPGAVAYTYLGYAGREAVAGGQGFIQKLLLALSLLAVVAFIPRIIARIRRGSVITVDTLISKLDNNHDFLLLDVRTSDEFTGEPAHIPGAVNIPLEQLITRISEIEEYLERTITVICRTHKRSAKAAQILTKNGFTDVHIVIGGMTEWYKKNSSTS